MTLTEISGIDLRQPLPAEQRAAVRRVWLEHGVVFLRDQPLTPDQFLSSRAHQAWCRHAPLISPGTRP